MANVIEDRAFSLAGNSRKTHEKQENELDTFGNSGFEETSIFTSHDLLSEIDSMEPTEREILMEELAIRSDFWDESEAFYG